MEVGKLSASISLAIGGFTSGVSTVMSGFSRMGSAAMGLNQTIELMKNAWRGLAGSIGGIAKSFVGVAAQMERSNIMLQQVTGSAKAAGEAFDWIQQQGAKAFGIEATTDAFVKMKSLGLDPLDGSLVAIEDALSAFGKNTPEALKLATVAITQMAGKGVISMEELRQQLAEQIPTSATIMARELGMSYQDMIDKISKGAIGAKEGLDALFKGLAADYGGMTDKMGNTWDGLMSKMDAAWFMFRKEVMDSEGLFGILKQGAEELYNVIMQLKQDGTLKQWAADIARSVVSAFELMIKAAGEFAQVIANLQGMWYGLKESVLGYKLSALQEKEKNIRKSTYFDSPEAKQKAIDAVVKEVQEATGDYASSVKSLAAAKSLRENAEHTVKTLLESIDRISSASGQAPVDIVTRAVKPPEIAGGGATVNGGGGKGASKGESDKLLEEFAKQFMQAQFDKQKIGMSRYDQELVKINENMAELALKYKDVIAVSPEFSNQIKELGNQLKENLSAEMIYENLQQLDDLMRKNTFEIATAEMNQYEATMADINFNIEEQTIALERLWGVGKVPDEVLDALDRYATLAERSAQAKQIGQVINAGTSIIDQLTLAGRTIGMGDTEAQFEGMRFQLEQMAAAGYDIGDAMERLNQMDLNALGFQLDLQIKKMMDWRGIMDNILGGWGNALAKFFEDFATTGKASLQELAHAMLTELQMLAAKMTAEMLMTSLKETVLGLVAMAARDPSSAQHFAAAAQAASAAGMFGAFVAGSGLAGMAHSGMSDIPQDGTWLLKKGERVVDNRTNADLKEYLKNDKKTQMNMTVNINNSDEEGVMKALPQLKKTIEDVVNSNISNNGSIRSTIINYIN